jgi:phosphoenolpyruvate-protein phosphotransferase (PTS system enzyme I)
MGAEKKFVGIAVSPGVATGKIYIYGKSHRKIKSEKVPEEIIRLEKAIMVTRRQLQEIQELTAKDLGEVDAELFNAHLLVLDDPSLIDEVVKGIQSGKNAEAAFNQVAMRYIQSLTKAEDNYLRERAADIRDVAHRVVQNLQDDHEHQDRRSLKEPCIVLAYDMTPSDTAGMDRSKVVGFGTDIGNETSSIALTASAMEIPAVVGLHDAAQNVEDGTFALLDGYGGVLIINPTEQTLLNFRRHL